MKYVVSINEKY